MHLEARISILDPWSRRESIDDQAWASCYFTTQNVVGPGRLAAADTRYVYGVFKLLRLVKRAAEFALDEY